MTREKILFLDDERAWCGPYLENLNDLFEVAVFHEVQLALDYFEHFQDVEALIVDVMMPPPPDTPATETNKGLETGIWFAEKMRRYVVAHRSPIVFLTNRDQENFADRLTQMALPEQLYEVRLKLNTSPTALPVIVKQMINAAKRR
jgi:CheY-like chemotaxis protein